MAITKTRTLVCLDVHPLADSGAESTANAKHPTIIVQYEHTFDDPDDDLLPAKTDESREITRYVEDGGSATDYSGEDALVRTVADAIWT
jgi:hypothetical protein